MMTIMLIIDRRFSQDFLIENLSGFIKVNEGISKWALTGTIISCCPNVVIFALLFPNFLWSFLLKGNNDYWWCSSESRSGIFRIQRVKSRKGCEINFSFPFLIKLCHIRNVSIFWPFLKWLQLYSNNYKKYQNLKTSNKKVNAKNRLHRRTITF